MPDMDQDGNVIGSVGHALASGLRKAISDFSVLAFDDDAFVASAVKSMAYALGHGPEYAKWNTRDLIGHMKEDWPIYEAIELFESYATGEDAYEEFDVDVPATRAAFVKARDAVTAAQEELIRDLEALAPKPDDAQGERPCCLLYTSDAADE